MARKFLALEFSLRICTLSKQGSWALFRPIDDNTGEWVQFTLRRHLSVSFAYEKSINSERLQNRSIFFVLLTHSGRWSLKKGILYKSMLFSGSLLLLHSKTMHESGILLKKIKLSLSLLMLVSRRNETLR